MNGISHHLGSIPPEPSLTTMHLTQAVVSKGETSAGFTRREAASIFMTGLIAAVNGSIAQSAILKDPLMTLTCFIRYQIDPFQREAFARYAGAWGRIIPRCGGNLIGYFLPWEGTNDVAWGLIAFDSLAAYEAYRARLRTDPESVANFTFAQKHKFILREERTFLENVPGTIGFTVS